MISKCGYFSLTKEHERADAITNGPFVDELVAPRNPIKTFSCEAGPKAGIETAQCNPTIQSIPGSLVPSSPWSVVEGFDDLVDLQGGGEWSIVYSSDESEGVETWTGDISYTP